MIMGLISPQSLRRADTSLWNAALWEPFAGCYWCPILHRLQSESDCPSNFCLSKKIKSAVPQNQKSAENQQIQPTSTTNSYIFIAKRKAVISETGLKGLTVLRELFPCFCFVSCSFAGLKMLILLCTRQVKGWGEILVLLFGRAFGKVWNIAHFPFRFISSSCSLSVCMCVYVWQKSIISSH